MVPDSLMFLSGSQVDGFQKGLFIQWNKPLTELLLLAAGAGPSDIYFSTDTGDIQVFIQLRT